MFSQPFANNIRTVSGTVSVYPDDSVLMCDTNAAPVIINLQAIAVNWNVNWKLYIVDASNNALVNNITINAPAGYTINQGSGATIAQNKGGTTVTIIAQTAYSASFNYNPSSSIGTVTSVDVSGGTTGFSFAGGPITTAGTLVMSGILNPANGGLGVNSYTKGDILVATNSTTLIKLPVGSNDQILTADSAQTSGVKWASPATLGTVTSVNASGGTTGLSFSGGPITSAGTLTLLGTLAAVNGGTGNNTFTKGDILVAVNSTTLVKLAVGTDGQALVVDSAQTAGIKWGTPSGSGTVTSVQASGGTTGLSFSGGPVTTSGTLTLAGTLGAANGGTGNSSYTKGDLLAASASTTLAKLAVGTNNYVLTADSAQTSGMKWAIATAPYFYARKGLLSTDTVLSIAPASSGNKSIILGQKITAYTSETENGLTFNSSTGEFSAPSNGIYSLSAKMTTRTSATNINTTGWVTLSDTPAFIVIGVVIERGSTPQKIVGCSEKEWVNNTLTSDVNLECTTLTFELQAEDKVYVTILNKTEYTIVNLAVNADFPDCFIDFSVFKIS